MKAATRKITSPLSSCRRICLCFCCCCCWPQSAWYLINEFNVMQNLARLHVGQTSRHAHPHTQSARPTLPHNNNQLPVSSYSLGICVGVCLCVRCLSSASLTCANIYPDYVCVCVLCTPYICVYESVCVCISVKSAEA